MLGGKPLFPGKDYLHQLDLIAQVRTGPPAFSGSYCKARKRPHQVPGTSHEYMRGALPKWLGSLSNLLSVTQVIGLPTKRKLKSMQVSAQVQSYLESLPATAAFDLHDLYPDASLLVRHVIKLRCFEAALPCCSDALFKQLSTSLT